MFLIRLRRNWRDKSVKAKKPGNHEGRKRESIVYGLRTVKGKGWRVKGEGWRVKGSCGWWLIVYGPSTIDCSYWRDALRRVRNKDEKSITEWRTRRSASLQNANFFCNLCSLFVLSIRLILSILSKIIFSVVCCYLYRKKTVDGLWLKDRKG